MTQATIAVGAENAEEFADQVEEMTGEDEGEGEQAELPQMPPTGPPSLKKMAALLTAVDKIYPDDFGPNYQWDRFREICDAAFRGGIRFVIPLVEWEAEQKARAEVAKAMGEAGDCATCGSRINTLDGSCANVACQSDAEGE